MGCGIQRQLPLVAQRPTDRIQLPLVTESNTSEVRRGVPKKKQCGNDRFRKDRKAALWCLLLGEAELAALLFVFVLSILVRTEERSYVEDPDD